MLSIIFFDFDKLRQQPQHGRVVRPRCILHSLRASKGNSKFDKVKRPHILVRKKTIANTDDIGHFIMDKIGEVKKKPAQ